MKIERGIHTFSLTAPCSYHIIQELRETQSHYVRKMSGARLTKIISLNKYKPQGVEILLTQSIDHRSWIRLIINPSSLRSGRYEPLALFQAEHADLKQIHKRLKEIIKELDLPMKLKDFKLNRVDFTWNLYCKSSEEVKVRLDIFRKSEQLPHYKEKNPRRKSGERDEAIDQPLYANKKNQHSWTTCAKNCEFSVYDKGYELKKQHGITILSSILRLELRISRQRLQKLAGKGNWEDQLRQLSKDQDKVMDKFLHRLHQDFSQVVHKKEALKRIEESSFQKRTKDKMRELVKKMSSCGSFTAARQKMGISKKSFIQLLRKFEKIKISPITLPQKAEIDVVSTGYQNGV